MLITFCSVPQFVVPYWNFIQNISTIYTGLLITPTAFRDSISEVYCVLSSSYLYEN